MTLPNRRDGLIAVVKYQNTEFDVTFNRDPTTGLFVECFYAETNKVKQGSDVAALLSDACIAISKRIEHGESFAQVAVSFGEDRAPGAMNGPPSSMLGAIARVGAALNEHEDVR